MSVSTPPPRGATYRMIWRWHFYSGLFCLPFIVWLSLTGMIYLFKPQIEPFLERSYAHVAHGPAQPPFVQVAAALAAVPGGVLNAYELPQTSDQATRILIGKGPRVIRVFVDPSTAQVLHVVDENDRFMRVIFYLHGELLSGTPGSMLVELAASWTIVMLLTGLYLWWPRGGRLRGVLVPRLGAGGRVFWRDLHAVTGFWISLMALFLLVSGLPWSKSWGGMLKTVRQTYAQSVVAQDWTIGSAAERQTNRAANTPVADEHAHMAGMGAMAETGRVDPDAYSPLDHLVPAVAKLGWPAPVLISPPSKLTPAWSARTDTQNRPQRVEARLDPASGAIVSQVRFADRPLLDRLIGYGVAVHEGQLFAPLNQVLGVVSALGLLTMAVSSVVLWWRRRPAGTLGAPAAHAKARSPVVVVALVCVLGVLLPLLGATLVLVVVVERIVLRRFPAARHVLGLTAPSIENANVRSAR
ncbi:PepSY-associated TM helix domain-containing protein [Luteibacter yeojuensis]|uniref:Peptidase n=1 Tax=Luteibacter yeojuensis TaxID=345309 RepID=A0A0F3L0P3_9GAMM|nr:PepSY domain-containing protein [Luteibacter yeojuensis]KJV36976.1 peptidase [Luteibacter yeojuensis]